MCNNFSFEDLCSDLQLETVMHMHGLTSNLLATASKQMMNKVGFVRLTTTEIYKYIARHCSYDFLNFIESHLYMSHTPSMYNIIDFASKTNNVAFIKPYLEKIAAPEALVVNKIGRHSNTDTLGMLLDHGVQLNMQIIVRDAIVYQNPHLFAILDLHLIDLDRMFEFIKIAAVASGNINIVAKIVTSPMIKSPYGINVVDNYPISVDYIETMKKMDVDLIVSGLLSNALNMQDRTLLSYVLNRYTKEKIDLVVDASYYKLEFRDMFDTLVESVRLKSVWILNGTSKDAIDYFLSKGYTIDDFYIFDVSLIDPPIMEYLISLGKQVDPLEFTRCVIMHDMPDRTPCSRGAGKPVDSYEQKISPNIPMLISYESRTILLKMLDNGSITLSDVIKYIKYRQPSYSLNELRQIYFVVKWSLRHNFDPILKTLVPLPAYPAKYADLVKRITMLCTDDG